MNKSKFIIIYCIFFLYSNMMYAQKDDYVVVDEVVAVVGANMIKHSDVETTYLQARVANKDQEISRCEILENMMINKLLLHKAEMDSITVTDAEVNNELDSRIKYMIQVYGSQERLEKQMNKTLPQIKESFYNVIKENILIQQAQSTVTGDVSITPQEVVTFFNDIPKDSLPSIEQQYTFSQIVILPKISEEEETQVKQKLEDIRNRILKGSKFSTLASLYSDDELSAKKGGELGFFSRGEMVSEFENIAFSLQPGEISPVFRTKFGYHIIQMIERRGDRINCRHILLIPKITAIQLYNAKTQLDSIKQLIDNGNISFEDAVLKYSQDESKNNNGLIINKNNASAVFYLDAINASMDNIDKVDFSNMQQGDITQPVEFRTESSNAYRLIKVVSKIEEHTVNLTDDFDKVQSLALNKKKNDILHTWASNILKKTYVKINDKYKNCNFNLNWNL